MKRADDNRIKAVMAIIFLLGAGILLKMYDLQVRKYDFYAAKADSQHKFQSVLEPERGRIFIQDDTAGDNGKLYPLATNKKFADVYAVPKDVKDPDMAAEQLYAVFKQAKTEKEVDDLLKKEEADARYQELKNLKREAEINSRKEAAIKKYLEILTKKNDPYEPIEQKVEEDALKKLYALMGSAGKEIKAQDLKVKDDIMLVKDGGGKEAELKLDGIGYMMKVYRFYPESNIGSNLLGFVGYVGDEQKGRYGLEEFFDEELAGRPGSIRAEKGAGGDLIIINDREYNKPQNGSDLILTINRTIQFAACQKLDAAVARHGADGGSVVVMEPDTGAILAMCSSPNYDPNNYKNVFRLETYNNPAIFAQYEPGSIFKAITMAVALDQERITPQTTYNDTGVVKIADYSIENSDRKAHGVVDMNKVLEESLNTGAIFAMRQVGPDVFGEYVKNFGFGEKAGIEMETEASGDIKNLTNEKLNKELYAATASFGQGIAVTPLQMAAAFGAVANGGILMKPYLVKEIVKTDGNKITTQPKQIRRVISERAATLLGGMLVNVVEEGHGKKAGVKGYYVAGKTGTAQVPKRDGRGYVSGAHIGSFAGFAPVDDPRFVMLVRIDNPRDVEWAESSAAPLFGEIADFLLNYWQVPAERKTE